MHDGNVSQRGELHDEAGEQRLVGAMVHLGRLVQRQDQVLLHLLHEFPVAQLGAVCVGCKETSKMKNSLLVTDVMIS